MKGGSVSRELYSEIKGSKFKVTLPGLGAKKN